MIVLTAPGARSPRRRACCASCCSSRRSSASPRSPGTSSRSRSATARSAASSPAAARSAGAGTRSCRGCGWRSSPPAILARGRDRRHGRAQLGQRRRRTDAGSKKARAAGTDEAGAADPGPGRTTRPTPPAKPSSTSATRPRRASTRPNTCRRESQRIEARYAEVGGQRSPHGDRRARARSKSASKANRTPRKSPKPGRPKASKAAGCWRWGPTRRPTSPPAPTSASANGSKK